MLLYDLYLAYTPWFKPKDYMRQWEKRKRIIKKIAPFLSGDFIEGVFIGPRSVTLWWARLGYVLFALILLFSIFFISFGSISMLP
jgi:hypothetical protein